MEKVLQVGIFVEEFAHDDRVAVYQPIDLSLLLLVLEEFKPVSFFWVFREELLYCSKEGDATCLLIVVNIWLVANNFEP